MQVDGISISWIVPSEVSRTSINDQIVVVRELRVLCNSARLHCYAIGNPVGSVRTEVCPILLPLVVACIRNTWVCKSTIREFCKACCGVEDDATFKAILQVRADAGKVDYDGDVETLELCTWTDAAEF